MRLLSIIFIVVVIMVFSSIELRASDGVEFTDYKQDWTVVCSVSQEEIDAGYTVFVSYTSDIAMVQSITCLAVFVCDGGVYRFVSPGQMVTLLPGSIVSITFGKIKTKEPNQFKQIKN